MLEDASVPFYLMESGDKFASDKCPNNSREVIAGIEGAIRNTKRKIAEYKNDKADTSELDFHLKNLEAWLEREKKKL